MKKIILPALCLLAGVAHADTTIRVDVTTDPGSKLTTLSTRSFDADVGHNFSDSAHISAYLTGSLGQDPNWLDVSYNGKSWQYFTAAADADGSGLPFAGLDRHVAAGGHIIEHFRTGLSRAYLEAHVSHGAAITFSGKNGSILVTLPAVFIHDYLETADKAGTSAAAETVASVKLHFGAQYLPLEPAFAAILGVPGQQGLLVTTVQAGSVAALAGVQQGDVMLKLGEMELHSKDELDRAVTAASAGSSLNLRIWRGGAATTVVLRF